ncbi:MAG: hydroxyphenylacetyl-CoA thioesterase PaaI [Arenicella sp.]
MDIKSKIELSQQQIAEKSAVVMHNADNCAKTLGMTVTKVTPGSSTVVMSVVDAYINGHGFCQGGIIATLADTAFAHASNSYNKVTVAQGLSIDFVRPVKLGETLTATASEIFRGRLIGAYKVLVVNQQEKLVAVMTGKSFSKNDAVFVD